MDKLYKKKKVEKKMEENPMERNKNTTFREFM